MMDADDNIIGTGYITGEPLNQLFTHAGFFVLPAYHEGLPIALLESNELWTFRSGIGYPGQPGSGSFKGKIFQMRRYG